MNAQWKLQIFVLATDSILDKHTACDIAKSYDNVIQKFKLTVKVTKVESDNATFMAEAF